MRASQSALPLTGSELNENAKTKGAKAGGNLSQVPPLEKGTLTKHLKNTI